MLRSPTALIYVRGEDAAVTPRTGYYLTASLRPSRSSSRAFDSLQVPGSISADQGNLAGVERLIGQRFPELKGKVLTLFPLTGENDVDAFERQRK